MTDLKTTLGEAAAAAFAEMGIPPQLGRVTPSDRPDLAHATLPAVRSTDRYIERP